LITHKKSKKLQDIIKHIDLDMLILETDSPFLAPVPYRGKTNEPAYVEIMAKKIADLKEVELDRVIAETCENANRLFQWDLN
jgi:TatD DNase family protein